MIVVMVIEGLRLRDTIIRVADSDFLRNFTRIYSGKMMNYTSLQTAMKHISTQTWQTINSVLRSHALKTAAISSDKLRVDSTVCETNIHYPTDASLLWDCYRVAVRLIRPCVALAPLADMKKRFHNKKVKKLYTFIATHSSKKKTNRALRKATRKLIEAVERTHDIAHDFLQWRINSRKKLPAEAQHLFCELCEMLPRMQTVVSCARRAYNGERVAASERIFSIFEQHTELLKRGKARKPVEFGHMVTIGQTAEKFISYYRVDEKSRHDVYCGDEAIREHKKVFGRYPRGFSADKNYYGGPEHMKKWQQKIPHYSVGKKGRRNQEEIQREHGQMFRLLQKFRAGCEGSISVLKRVFGLYRCLFRSFKSFSSSIGSIIFCHNLVVLSRL
jgi:IS5 family transposase